MCGQNLIHYLSAIRRRFRFEGPRDPDRTEEDRRYLDHVAFWLRLVGVAKHAEEADKAQRVLNEL